MFAPPSRLRLLVLLCGLLAPASLRAGVYFLQNGPPPLRFMEAAKTNAFLWAPLSPAENSASRLGHASARPLQTNAAVSLNPGAVSSTETNGAAAPAVSEPVELTDLSSSSNALVNLDANTPSARELLVVTPQMLAEYLRSTPGVVNRPGTNTVVIGEVPFTPPTPKVVPSSEAIYRTQ
jgi:hypothetical protein